MKPRICLAPWKSSGAHLKTIFCDIDGTVCGPVNTPHPDVIVALARAKAKGWGIVLWSGNGKGHARKMAAKHKIPHDICLDKPAIAVDDEPEIRPKFKGWLMSPEEFLKWAK